MILGALKQEKEEEEEKMVNQEIDKNFDEKIVNLLGNQIYVMNLKSCLV